MTVRDRPEIPPLSRIELYGILGLHRVMEPITEELMRERNERELRSAEIARGQAWHTSFHASEFPGDSPDACERYLVYRMMDFPPAEAMPPWVTTTGDVGKAGELTIARSWWEGGRALAVPDDESDDEQQLVFEHSPLWMSGSIDLPVLKPFWTKPHLVEIKGKADEVLEEMINGVWDARQKRVLQRRWDDPHRRQLLASLGLAHEYEWGSAVVCEKTWHILQADVLKTDRNPDGTGFGSDSVGYCPRCEEYGCGKVIQLEPPTTGSIYYWSRSWPRKTVEFYFEHDPAFMETGRDVLRSAREHFEKGTIPPRRDNFMWSIGPCKKCPQKKFACKPDFGKPTGKNPVPPTTKLLESNGVKHAQELRPDYDPEAARAAVLERWNA
jgi:hypothetical protein